MMLGGKSRPKIRAPRKGVSSSADVDFDTVWGILESAFTEIHTKNASQLSFETLYRNAYKVVLKKQGEQLYDKVGEFESKWLSGPIRYHVESILTQELIDGPESAVAMSGQHTTTELRFLRELRQAWQDHQVSMSMLTDVMMYMDRTYCTDTRRPSIFAKAMSIFRDEILYSRLVTSWGSTRQLQEILNDVILDQIRMDRAGDYTDKALVKANVYMLEGMFETETEAEDEKLYVKQFEPAFLAESRTFYRQEGEAQLKQLDAGNYCKHTMHRIHEEMDRCRSTLSDTTTAKIVAVVEDELIRDKITTIIEMDTGVRFMITNDRLDDLRLVYDLEKRIDPKKPELTRAVQKIVAEMGQVVNAAALTASTSTAAPPAPAENGEDKGKAGQDKLINSQTVAALKWVEDILELKDRFDRIWKDSFSEDQVLQAVLTRSLGEVINSFSRCSEYISLFIDDNMKKGIKDKTEEEVDRVLEKAITLLRYVQDKDVFENYYKRHLCRRLIMSKSLSTDAERSMIGRMKIELGNSFTLKLEAMFKDMALSEELTASYKKYVAGLGDTDYKRVELAIHVLTSMTWPLETMKGSDEGESRLKTIYPPAIDRLKTSFEQFYAQRHSGRVLSWRGDMGTADIKATFPKVPSKDGPRSRTHELNVSTYAMIVLQLFNDLPPSHSLTFEEIQGRTNIPTSELIRNLQSLAVAPKTRVLIKEPMSKDVKPTDRFSFNESFTSKFIKIKVGVVSANNRVENDRERKETEKKNNDNRGFVVEAAIVRIMKQRKELAHAQLITETLAQLSAQFKPDVTMIKKKIESLIEREYLERMEEAPVPMYRYMA